MASINDLKSDHKNARRRTDRSSDLIKESLQRYGAARSIVIDEENRILAGNGTIDGAKAAGIRRVRIIESEGDEVIAVRRSGLSEEEKVGLALADNRTADLSEWDQEMLHRLSEEHDLEPWFNEDDLNELLSITELDPEKGNTDPDEIPEEPQEPITKPGDLWILGNHRVLCGDSTCPTDIERLLGGEKAALLHADPPYGMGKASDGVANDNLYDEKLDSFQMEWWATFRPYLEDNASAYIWGNAPELWRLWYKAGLGDSERLTMRSQIIWDKPPSASAFGSPIGSEKMRSFPHGYEVCLFFMLGEQGFNNNADNYWEGWEPLRSYLETQMKSLGWKTSDLNKITETQMGGHWVTKSQWTLPTAEQYAKIQAAAGGAAFTRGHEAFKKEHDELKREHDKLKREFYETRAYFDNAHDNMTDVWDYPRVHGDERHGHATPKPVDMMKRVMLTSLPKNGLCLEPFGGSGSTLMGAQLTNRRCYTVELKPEYCDVIVKRWESFTGETAVLASDKD